MWYAYLSVYYIYILWLFSLHDVFMLMWWWIWNDTRFTLFMPFPMAAGSACLYLALRSLQSHVCLMWTRAGRALCFCLFGGGAVSTPTGRYARATVRVKVNDLRNSGGLLYKKRTRQRVDKPGNVTVGQVRDMLLSGYVVFGRSLDVRRANCRIRGQMQTFISTKLGKLKHEIFFCLFWKYVIVLRWTQFHSPIRLIYI